MPNPRVTVVVPTLAADSTLLECMRSLENQTFQDFEVVVVDNSGRAAARVLAVNARVIENERNVGFGAAINQAYRASSAPLLATLNDDAAAHPDWLARLVEAADADPESGMFASQVRLAGDGRLDSAGMLICADGSSKQRGHLAAPEQYGASGDALLPSGSAALYRREMLEVTGGFDESFFLYCEDTDLGLRARRAGWDCRYVPGAVVEHRYSHSAGRASALKAYYVERNRLFLLIKNFPASMLWKAPFCTFARYLWHALYLLRGSGAAARFKSEGNQPFRLLWFVLRAHAALLRGLPRLVRERRQIRQTAFLTDRQFSILLRRHSISAREVAAL